MEPAFAEKGWKRGEAKFFSDTENAFKPFYFRPIDEMIKHFFKQPAFRDHLIYKPIRDFNASGDRVYSDLHTADWWWEEQVQKPPGRGMIVADQLLGKT